MELDIYLCLFNNILVIIIELQECILNAHYFQAFLAYGRLIRIKLWFSPFADEYRLWLVLLLSDVVHCDKICFVF